MNVKPGDLISTFSHRIGIKPELGGHSTVRKFGIIRQVYVRFGGQFADVFWCDGKFDDVFVMNVRRESVDP